MDTGACNYRRFLQGDEDGLVEIIRDYKDGLMLYINEYVGDIHVAEDLCEDTFVRLFVRQPHFSGKSTFKTWLYAIGRHIAADYLRKASRVTLLPPGEVEVMTLEADTESVATAYLRDERKATLHRALGHLPQDYRVVLHLSFFENLKNPQIAAVLGKSTRQVENLLYRAKGALRTEMEKEGFVYEDLP